MPGVTVLIIEDEQKVAAVVKAYLERDGFLVTIADNGLNGLNIFHKENPDIVILDVMLPGMDGFEICREIRKIGPTPIIMLTARVDETDRVAGLELGADDYVCKPFSPRELVARVKAVLRRHKSSENVSAHQRRTFPGLIIDLDQRRAIAGQVEMQLTLKEFDLLAYLTEHPGQVYTREMIYDRVWSADSLGDLRTVDVHVTRLRNKLERAAGHRFIETVWGLGYSFREKADA